VTLTRPIMWICIAASIALSQPAAKFEVAAIKPASSAELDAIKRSGRSSLFPEQGISISGNRVTVLGLTTETLIRAAYNLRAYQFSGGAGWTSTEAYDIAAKAETGTALSFAQVRLMLQTLLADRFRLEFHRETKEGPGYALGVGKSGSRLKTSAAPEYSTHVTAGKSQVQMTLSKASIDQLCGRLSTFVSRPVVDQTGLTGVFDLKLSFTPDDGESESPSIFTALQEQLGLKLESTKTPIDVLIIDRIARPSAN
jgi:uncharacterized protein (TIGR03435 family)